MINILRTSVNVYPTLICMVAVDKQIVAGIHQHFGVERKIY